MLGITRELRDGVADREGPLNAEATGLLLCRAKAGMAEAPAMCCSEAAPRGFPIYDWVWMAEGLGVAI